MSTRVVYVCLCVLATGWLAPGALIAQVDDQLGDSLALAFEPEVFAYPQYERRNPFKTLLSAEGGATLRESVAARDSPFAVRRREYCLVR